MSYPRLTLVQIDDLILSKWTRLEGGCRQWNGTLSSTGSPVVKIEGRQYSVKALLDFYTYGGGSKPKRRFCGTANCAHPRHIAKPLNSPVAV